MSSELFRDEALEAKNRLDTLPQRMRVTSGITRFVFAALTLTMAGAIAWSAFVVIPLQVPGHGVLLNVAGDLNIPVRSRVDAIVERISVYQGAQVRKGQIIGRLRLPKQQNAIEELRREIAILEHSKSQRGALVVKETAGENKVYLERRNNAAAKIGDLEKRTQWAGEQVTSLLTLFKKGITTNLRVNQARIALATTREQLDAARAELRELDAAKTVSTDGHAREIQSIALRIELKRSVLQAQLKDLRQSETIIASTDGLIAEIDVDSGTAVHSGQRLASILPIRSNNGNKDRPQIEAVIFVPLSSGKRVKPDDRVLISPSSLSSGTHDRVRAKVISVSQIPTSKSYLQRVLGNAGFAQLAAQGGPPFAVHVALDTDRTSPSGLAWTSGRGPDLLLTPGTPISGKITVERKPLLSLALPALRKLFATSRDEWTGAPR